MMVEESYDRHSLGSATDAIRTNTNVVPAFLGVIGLMAIGRTLGLKAFDAVRPRAQNPIMISVWSFEDAPKALQVLAAPRGAPPRHWSVVAFLPAATSVYEALRLLALPDEDHGEMQIVVLPDGGHVVFSERQPPWPLRTHDHDQAKRRADESTG